MSRIFVSPPLCLGRFRGIWTCDAAGALQPLACKPSWVAGFGDTRNRWVPLVWVVVFLHCPGKPIYFTKRAPVTEPKLESRSLAKQAIHSQSARSFC